MAIDFKGPIGELPNSSDNHPIIPNPTSTSKASLSAGIYFVCKGALKSRSLSTFRVSKIIQTMAALKNKTTAARTYRGHLYCGLSTVILDSNSSIPAWPHRRR